jgi:SAM-dependent methyltransferase
MTQAALQQLRRAADSAQRITKLFIDDPRQLRYLARWWPDRRASEFVTRHIPWLTYGATDWLATVVGPASRVFEFGSGGSTFFFLDLGASVTSVEHEAAWHARVAAALPAEARARAVLRLVEPRPPAPGESDRAYVSAKFDGVPRDYESYARSIDAEPDGSFDLVLVDGRARVACVRHARAKVRPGGYLVLDDSSRPEYAAIPVLLAGWLCRRFSGLGPGKRLPAETASWGRPVAARA